MDFSIISNNNDQQQILLERSMSSNTKSWILNMDNDDYFNWSNGFDDGEIKTTKKRKLDAINCNNNKKDNYKYSKTNGLIEEENNQKDDEKKINSNGKFSLRFTILFYNVIRPY